MSRVSLWSSTAAADFPPRFGGGDAVQRSGQGETRLDNSTRDVGKVDLNSANVEIRVSAASVSASSLSSSSALTGPLYVSAPPSASSLTCLPATDYFSYLHTHTGQLQSRLNNLILISSIATFSKHGR